MSASGVRSIASGICAMIRKKLTGNQTLSNGIIFAVCAGITRSSSLWLLPLLTNCMTLADYGIFSLIQISGPILAEIFNLNGGAAIIREGILPDGTAFALVKWFGAITLGVTMGFLLVATALQVDLMIKMAITIGGCEGLHALLFSYFRVKNQLKMFVLMTFLKLLGQVAILLGAIEVGGGLRMILTLNIASSALISLAFFGLIGLRQRHGISKIVMRAVLTYTVFLIPHGLAQWVLSGSDRFVIKRFCAVPEVGSYNIAYTLAGVVMLVNTGLAMALPPDFFKRYLDWMEGGLRGKFIKLYSCLVVVLIWLTMGMLRLDHSHLGLIKHFSRDTALLIATVATGLYFLGIYYFYVNVLFYHRKTWAIARATMVSACLNLSLTVVLVMRFGSLGAALSTAITYAFYLLYTVKIACDLEPEMRSSMIRDLAVCPAAALLVFASYFAGRI